MPDDLPPKAFADVLADPARPLIVGGQAVNIWAEIYRGAEPSLSSFEPFTSKDADIYGDRALAETLRNRSGWECTFFEDVRQIAVAYLSKPVTPENPQPLKIEVLCTIRGLTDADLARDALVTLREGEVYRISDPLVLLKAKLANLAEIKTDRPQDLKHTQMLIRISRAYLHEAHAMIGRPDVSDRNFVEALMYAKSVITSDQAKAMDAKHSLNLVSVFPPSLRMSTHERVQNFAQHQLSRIEQSQRITP